MIEPQPFAGPNKFHRFYLQPDDENECWKLFRRDNIGDEGEDWHVADFHDGDMRETKLGMAVCAWLNNNLP